MIGALKIAGKYCLNQVGNSFSDRSFLIGVSNIVDGHHCISAE